MRVRLDRLSLRGRADRGLALEHGRLVVLWVPRVILPGSMVLDLDVETLLSVVVMCLVKLLIELW